MNPKDLTQFYIEANQAGNETEHLARLLFELRNLTGEANETATNNIATRTKEWEYLRSDNYKASQERRELISTAEGIIQAVQEKDLDLSGVIAGLESVRAEIEASRQEEKDDEPMEEERHRNLLSAISGLIQATKENKPESVDLSPVTDKTEETAKKTHKLLSDLIAEIRKIDVRPEVKVDIPKEVEVKEPKWYKPFSFDTKWLKPIEYAINAINPKPALARVEEWMEKIYKKPLPKVPLNKDGSRVLVEVDRTGGGGSGVIDKLGNPINPATEEKQDAIIANLGGSITAASTSISSSGDNTIVAITNTPKLYYVSLSADGSNGADVTATVKVGASSKYKVSLKAGAIWARNIGAGRWYVTGSAGEDIIVNLSAAQTVHVSVEYADAA